tara:strand:- start:243 stop:695 length:453 start_codon:yes stop_codon:yes gene_type:complete
MARQISILQIPQVMEEAVETLVAATTLEWTARVKKATPVFSLDNYPNLDSIPNFFTLPNGQVVPFRKALLDRGSGGELREAWQTQIKKFSGLILNNKPYAEPVCFGTNLPPSWRGKYRTRQNTQAGFPELIGKELQKWADDEYQKIKRRL